MTAIIEKSLKDVRWFYVVLFIIMSIGAYIYIPLPARPTQMTIDYYNIISAAKPGQTVIITPDLGANVGQGVEMSRGSTITYLVNKGVRVILTSGASSFPYELLWYKEALGIPSDVDINQDPRYGQLFTVMASVWYSPYLIAANMRSTANYDLFGTNFDNIPMMKDLKTGKDIYAIVGSYLGGDFTVAFSRERTGTYCLTAADSGALAVAATYYGTGLLKGVLIGNKGAMEFESLIGLGSANTWARQTSTPFALIALYVFIAVLVVNIANQYSIRVKKKKLSFSST